MARIRHHKQAPAAVPADRYHRGVVHVVEFLSNRLIEIPHEPDLFQCEKVSLHEFLKLLAQRHHGQSMPAHVGKRDTRDDAIGAERNVMDIAASVARAGRYGMHPCHQTGQLDQTGGSLVAGPCFGTLKSFWHRRHPIHTHSGSPFSARVLSAIASKRLGRSASCQTRDCDGNACQGAGHADSMKSG